jgi:manganese transport protein
LSFSLNQFDEMAAIVGTTFVLNACIYQAYLVYDKGWKINDLKIGLRDTLMGITVLGLISTLIIVTSAAALYPKGIIVTTAADMSIQLEALFGNFSKYIFNIGLCAAAFSSLVINAVIGGGLLSDGLGFGRSMQDKIPKIFTTLVLLIGMIIAVFFRGDIVYALVLAQGSTLFAVPSIGIGLLLVANNKMIMRDLQNNRTQNIIAAIGFMLILIMVVYMYHRLITFLGNL